MDLEKLLHGGEMDGTLAALIHSRLRAISFLVGAVAVVTDNSAISEECAASSSQLSSYSDALKENVGRFRTR